MEPESNVDTEKIFSGTELPVIQHEAPKFECTALMPDKNFETVSLDDYKGCWTILLFFPLDFTFVCPTEIIAFSDAAKQFEEIGAYVIAASCDSKFAHLAWVNTSRDEGGLGDMNIPILADFDKVVAQKYGVLLNEDGDDDGVPLRGTFIISPTGILRQMTVNDLPVGRSVEEMLRLVKAFQFTDEHGEVCPANWKPGEEGMTADPTKSKDWFNRVHGENGEGIRQRNTTSNNNNNNNVPKPVRRGNNSGSVVTISDESSGGLSGIGNWFAEGFSNYKLLIKNYPLRTKSITSLIIGIIGEILGGYYKARSEGKRYKVDFKRIGVFGAYGFCITGPILHYWYQLLERITTTMDVKGVAKTIVKLFIDRAIFGPPFVLLTVSFIQFLQHLSFSKAGQQIKRTFVAVLLSNQKFWCIAQILNFGVVPVDLQLLYVNIASVLWNTILSLAS